MQNKKERTVSFKVINLIFLSLTALLCLLLVFLTIILSNSFRKYINISSKYVSISRAALDLQEGSDYLTDEARLFVASTDYKHLENYFYETNVRMRRQNAIDIMHSLSLNKDAAENFLEALSISIELQEMELYCMKMAVQAKHYDTDPNKNIPIEIRSVQLYEEDENLEDEYKLAKAWIYMYSEEYMNSKAKIRSLKNFTTADVFAREEEAYNLSTKNLKNQIIILFIITSLIFLIITAFCAAVVFHIIKPLIAFNKNILSDQKLIHTSTKELNILSKTYNTMYERNKTSEVLLRHKAEHDELTGLINRAGLSEIIEALKNSNTKISVIIIDVDNFKTINDSYGHITGDKVLKRISDNLIKTFRAVDYVARIGGDEFLVIMTDCDINVDVLEKIISEKLSAIFSKLKTADKDIPAVTLSCGIAISENGYSEELYKNADLSLYEIKRSGRNGFKFFHK